MSLVLTSNGIRKVLKPCDFSKVPPMDKVSEIFTNIAKGFKFEPIILSGESQPAEIQGDGQALRTTLPAQNAEADTSGVA